MKAPTTRTTTTASTTENTASPKNKNNHNSDGDSDDNSENSGEDTSTRYDSDVKPTTATSTAAEAVATGIISMTARKEKATAATMKRTAKPSENNKGKSSDLRIEIGSRRTLSTCSNNKNKTNK